MTFSALVVGLGQIGMGYDLGHDPAQIVSTHARAFDQHPRFQLAGGVDSDDGRRQLFQQQYGKPAFASIGAAMAALTPDVVAVATPTAAHGRAVSEILAAGAPKAMLCEKPLSLDVDEARIIVEQCRARDCRLFVNYIRRSDPGVAEVKRRLEDGSMRRPVKGVVWYSKGLFNNGSHFLNVLEHWLGPVTGYHVLAPGRMWAGLDPEPDVQVTFADGTVYFLAAREEDYSHYTVELVAPNGRLRYEQGGARIIWQSTLADASCAGYTVLNQAEQRIATDLDRIQWHVADQMAASLDGHAARICTGDEALQTVQTLAQIRGSL